MKISEPDLAVYPVMKALTIEVVGLGIADLRVTVTGAEPAFREPKST